MSRARFFTVRELKMRWRKWRAIKESTVRQIAWNRKLRGEKILLTVKASKSSRCVKKKILVQQDCIFVRDVITSNMSEAPPEMIVWLWQHWRGRVREGEGVKDMKMKDMSDTDDVKVINNPMLLQAVR